MMADSSAGNAKVKSASAHHQLLDPAAPRRGEQAERDADDEADADRDDADRDRVLRADEQQRGDVAAEAVGAEPVRGRRRAASLFGTSMSAGGYGVQTSDSSGRGAEQQRDEHARPTTKLGWRARASPERGLRHRCAFSRGSITA